MAQPPPVEPSWRTAVRWRAGLVCWLVQPVYLVVELLVAAAASSAYSLGDDTISTLGQVSCTLGEGGSVVGVCSGGHAAMNAAFVGFGLLRGVGAILLRDRFRATWWRTAATGLWIGSGVCSAAVGLVPVDQYPTMHAVVATPIFVLQPLALLATAVAWGRTTDARRGDARRGVRATGLVAGTLSVIGSLVFGARLGQPIWEGAAERLALWPAYLWLGLCAATLLPVTRPVDGQRSRR